jgi:hypothetical protein
MNVLQGVCGFMLMICAGLAQAQSAGNGMRPRTADAADGMLFFESVLQGHFVDTCKRLSPQLAPQLDAAWKQWQHDRAARLRNGRAYSLKVFEERGSNEKKESDEIKESVRSRFEPQIAADPQTRCAAMLQGIKGDALYKDAALPVPTRGGTLASPTLTQDVYKQAQVVASCLDTESVELLVLERTPTLIREQWILHGCGKASPMQITFTPGTVRDTTNFVISPEKPATPTGE